MPFRSQAFNLLIIKICESAMFFVPLHIRKILYYKCVINLISSFNT